jgi:Fe-S-cluster-containing hydrogenase component 2
MVVGEKASRIKVDHKRCTGCRMCEQVCVFFHEREFNPRRARIRILMNEKEGVYAPLLCNQCQKCLSACNRDALSWDGKVGVIRVDAKKCNGCGLCLEACPEGAIFLDPISGIVNICDLCHGDPQCVKWCAEKVLV